MATTHDARVSVHDLEGEALADYIAAHEARWGFPPLAGADGADEDGGDEGDDDGEPQGKTDDDPEGQGDTEPDWKREARKHERRAKATAKELEAERAERKKLDDAQKSESEKAIEAAREAGRTEALTEAQKERRADRLEVAVTRAAARTFADTEDALVQIERAIAKGDLDEADIFTDEGKVQTEALTSALEDLLERKPHLAAAPAGGSGDRRIKGGSGAGKGSGGGKDLEGMTVEDHLNSQRRHKP